MGLISHKTTYTYDVNRNLIQVLEANLHKTVNTYNLDNQLAQVQRAGHHEEAAQLDPAWSQACRLSLGEIPAQSWQS